MSQETLTELEKGIDSDTLQSINETFDAESAYDKYIVEERVRRKRQRQKERKKQLEKAREENIQPAKSENEIRNELEDENIDYELTEHTARITKIVKKENREVFKLHLTDKNGEKITEQNVEIGLPEDKSSEWVRICEMADVDPTYPTELRGEIVPLKINNDSPVIDMPPVNAGLNPIRYKTRRKIQKLSIHPTTQKIKPYVEKSFPLWGTVLLFIVSLISFGISGYLIESSVLLSSVASIPFVLGSAVGLSLSVMYGLYYWGLAGLFLLYITVRKIYKYTAPPIKKMYRYVFPK